MTAKEMMARRVEAPDALLEQALSEAEGMILDLTHRSRITAAIMSLQVSLAAVYAHRMLAAGESSRSEGGVSVTYAYSKEIPDDLLKRIMAKRLLKQAEVAKNADKES